MESRIINFARLVKSLSKDIYINLTVFMNNLTLLPVVKKMSSHINIRLSFLFSSQLTKFLNHFTNLHIIILTLPRLDANSANKF